MKFLCLHCDEVMQFAERQIPGDGTLAVVFGCPTCGREVAMLANPMETQFVSSMGIRIGGREVPEQPMELVRGNLAGGGDDAFDDDAFDDGDSGDDDTLRDKARDDRTRNAGSADPNLAGAGVTAATPAAAAPPPAGRVTWSADAQERLGHVPSFVRGMVKRIYADYARERGIAEITPAIMDRARTELGLEGM